VVRCFLFQKNWRSSFFSLYSSFDCGIWQVSTVFFCFNRLLEHIITLSPSLFDGLEITWTWPAWPDRTIFPEKTSAWACGSVAGALAWRIWTGSGAELRFGEGCGGFFYFRADWKSKSYGKARNMIFMIAADHLIIVKARSFVNLGGTRSPSWNHMPMFFMLITGPLVVLLVI